MKRLYVLIITALLLVSCDKNDDSYSGLLDGKWVLQRAICYCYFGDDFNFNGHQIVINQKNNLLQIQNSDETYFINTTGQYLLEVDGNELIVDKKQKYTFVQNNNSLTLSYVDNPMIADDEIVLKYIRAE